MLGEWGGVSTFFSDHPCVQIKNSCISGVKVRRRVRGRLWVFMLQHLKLGPAKKKLGLHVYLDIFFL